MATRMINKAQSYLQTICNVHVLSWTAVSWKWVNCKTDEFSSLMGRWTQNGRYTHSLNLVLGRDRNWTHIKHTSHQFHS